jgi:hypothetical protein
VVRVYKTGSYSVVSATFAEAEACSRRRRGDNHRGRLTKRQAGRHGRNLGAMLEGDGDVMKAFDSLAMHGHLITSHVP